MEKLYANIIVDITHEKLDRIFQYLIPEKLRGILSVGDGGAGSIWKRQPHD